MARKKISVQVLQGDAGLTLGTFLRKKLQFTKAQIRSMKFREHGLAIDGERARIDRVLQPGMMVEVQLEEELISSDHLIPQQDPIDILYEDEDLIAVWKEAGIVLHPTHGHYQDTLSNRIYGYFQEKQEKVMIRSIGRLDRDTCGIIIFAKNQIAAARLWEQKQKGLFYKEYIAKCMGRPQPSEENGKWITIDAPIGKRESDLMRMCIDEKNGKPSITHYRWLEDDGENGWVQVRIETGRTHQIRLHMASVGHPLTGDLLYGQIEKEPMILCAWKVRLQQPFTNVSIELRAGERLPGCSHLCELCDNSADY